MKTSFIKLVGNAALVAIAAASAQAGDWGFECVDPENTAPRSDDHAVIRTLNSLMHAATGVSGTATYGGQNGPCFAPQSITLNIQGGFGFMSGALGSVQDQNPADPNDTFVDDNLVYTFGMPTDPNRNFNLVTILEDGAQTAFGSSGFGFFNGLSGRYYQITSTQGNVGITLRVDVIGDAAKLTWQLNNLDADNAHTIGMWFGMSLGMLTIDPSVTDTNGASQSHRLLGGLSGFTNKPGFVELPSGRPPIADNRYSRNVDPASFPDYVNFLFGQTAAYGLRVDNGPTVQTRDSNGNSDATTVTEFVLGKSGFLIGDDAFNDVVQTDTGFRNSTAFIQKYAEENVLAGGSRTIVQYFRTPWGNGNYADPYTVVVDAPQLVAVDENGQNGLSPNPMTVRVYVDNAQTFAVQNQQIPLQDVDITLEFPDGSLQLFAGEVATKTIDQVNAGQMLFVDYQVETDGDSFGDLPYRVTVSSTPGGTKTINGVIKVSSTPRLRISQDANLVTAPWIFNDSSWESVLGLSSPEDFRAYEWDPEQQGYVVSTAARRGFSAWIVSNAEFGVVPLSSNPQTPPDIATGAPNIQLKSGWNLIGNPYPYAIRLNQIVGAPNGSGSASFTWNQLVSAGYVNSAVVYYDPNTADYVFVQGTEAELLPNRGYWLFVNTQNDLTLSYPPVYARALPDSPRRPTSGWVQSEKQWRLQLSARSEKSQDTQNFIGFVKTAKEAASMRLPEIPMSPVQNVSLSVTDLAETAPTRLSQSYADKIGRKEWKVAVTTTEATSATITWPNLSTIPKNMRIRITDLATNTTRDLRQSSGYTFTTNGPATREFKLEVAPGGVTRAVIGPVLVGRSSRAPQAPVSIRYTLTSDASTTIRILSGSGKEVFTVTRGRADRTGENEAVWTLRDNANRLVAPGAYRVEILAETSTGDRVRKIVPVNIIR
jgi:hypothetical protein